MKGPAYKKEIDDARDFLKILGARIDRIKNIKLNSKDKETIERNLIIIKKITDTLNRFPRRAGVLQKRKRQKQNVSRETF